MARVIHLKASGGTWTAYARRKRNLFFLAYAHDFLRVSFKAGSPLVRAYLLGHALELLLKTYLLEGGFGERSLRGFGHNVSRLLAECQVGGLTALVRVSPQLEKDVRAFSDLYRSKALQYFSILYLLAPPKLPDTHRIERFARVLERALFRHMRAA